MALNVSSSCIYAIALVCYAALVTMVVAQQSADIIRSQCLREFGADGTNERNIVSPLKVMACIFKKEGIMTADGHYSRAKAIEIAHAAFTDRIALATAIRAAEHCQAEIGPDAKTEEETAAMMVRCFAKNGQTTRN